MQIIFNIFRQRPAELFFGEAQRRRVGILARVPLASGMLSGKFTRASTFAADDHRGFNRHGEVVRPRRNVFRRRLRAGLAGHRRPAPAGAGRPDHGPNGAAVDSELSGSHLRHPGAKRPAQVEENARAADLPPLPEASLSQIRAIYDQSVRPHVHHYW